MAANDYYYQGSRDDHPPYTNTNSPSPAPYAASSRYAPTPLSAGPPTLPGLGFSQTPRPLDPPSPIGKPPGASPFDTPFDDNAYSMNSRTNLAPGSPSDAHAGYYPDSAYYGHGRASPDPRTEDIPLQENPHKTPGVAVDFDDHVYDDPNARKSRRRKKKKAMVAEGYLGMHGANKKRIPWVVYIFSIAQIGVFIGEIIQNGRSNLAILQARC